MYHPARFGQALASLDLQPWHSPHGIVKVVQYGDFQCPECGRAAASLQDFRHRNDGVIDFTYKHFPASAPHRHALAAAAAAECARTQGMFWPMHDLLFRSPARLDPRSLYDHARSIGLDMARFEREMDHEAHMPAIRSHVYSGTLAGVRRTPAYFVDGNLVDFSGGLRGLFAATDSVLLQRRGCGLAST
jgi:protein-disulfide isomerase